MDDYGWVVVVIVVIVAIAFWPVTLCIGAAYGGYRIYKKNELNTLNDNLSAAEWRLSSTQSEIATVKAQREDLTAKIRTTGEHEKELLEDYVAVNRFVSLFSGLGDYSVSPAEGILALEGEMGAEADARASMEAQGRSLDTRASQLQQRSSELASEIDIIKQQISAKKR